jgi:DNA (cytosine-5)-methyltransferase 1
MKILNLYCGIGGNRKLWPEGNEVTAVEMNPDIAKIYKDFFPDDNVIVGDAHQYLLEHYKEYDFIWASPPCPTHSTFAKMRALSDNIQTGNASTKVKYIDMKLYQEIILLQNFMDDTSRWVVENVEPYYEPLIKCQKSGRHLFWSNFYINNIHYDDINIKHTTGKEIVYGFDISKYNGIDKRKTLRNCVNPKLGLHIYNCAFKNIQMSLI